MLKIKTKEQRDKVAEILDRHRISWWAEDLDKDGIDGISVDDFISFDQMAEIVDLLRKEDNARRKKARLEGMHAEIDGLCVAGDAIFLRGVEKDEAERFILSLGALGYDTQVLMDEYTKTNKITI